MNINPMNTASTATSQQISSNPGEFEEMIGKIANAAVESLNEKSYSPQVFKALAAYFFVFLQPISEKDPFWSKESSEEKKIVIHVTEGIGKGGYKTAFKIKHTFNVVLSESSDTATIENCETQIPCALLVSKRSSSSLELEIKFLQNYKNNSIVELIAEGIVTRFGGEEKACHEVLQGSTSGKIPVMFMELMNTDLKSHLYSEEINSSEALCLINQLLKGINYLNSISFVHPDIKLENILLKWENGKLYLKFSDFGGATNFASKQGIYNYTPQVAAPELVFQHVLKRLKKININSVLWMNDEDKNNWIGIDKVNFWGAGVVIYGIVTKLLHDKKTLPLNLYRFSWSRDLVKLNEWALPQIYPKCNVSSNEARDKFKSVCSAIKSFNYRENKNTIENKLQNLVITLLSLNPSKRKYSMSDLFDNEENCNLESSFKPINTESTIVPTKLTITTPKKRPPPTDSNVLEENIPTTQKLSQPN